MGRAMDIALGLLVLASLSAITNGSSTRGVLSSSAKAGGAGKEDADNEVILGEDYWIVCDMYGKPQPNITWMKSGEKINGWNPHMFNQPHRRWPWRKYIVSSHPYMLAGGQGTLQGKRSNLTIHNVNTDDFGVYSCGTKTHAGEYFRRIRLGANGIAVIPHELDNLPDDFPTWAIVVTVTVGIIVLITLVVIVAYCARHMEKKMQQKESRSSRAPRKQPPVQTGNRAHEQQQDIEMPPAGLSERSLYRFDELPGYEAHGSKEPLRGQQMEMFDDDDTPFKVPIVRRPSSKSATKKVDHSPPPVAPPSNIPISYNYTDSTTV